MFHHKITFNKQPEWHKSLTKIKQGYDKVIKELNEPVRDLQFYQRIVRIRK